MSLGAIVFVAALSLGATGAFFSDSETSTGNTFTAGNIDLQIDNESYAVDNTIANFISPVGRLVFSTTTSWTLKDLVPGVDHFFNFSDLKPGDLGEDTISIHVGSNNAWMCVAAEITSDLDISITEPEDNVGGGPGSDGTTDGDLDSALKFVFWHDDGDNVLETDEVSSIFLSGTLANMGTLGKIKLADSSGSILGGNTPIPGGTTFYIGKAWCMGTLTADGTTAKTPDAVGHTGTGTGDSTNGPMQRGTGVNCDGSTEGNIAQTDSVVGDMQFYAVQSRNNPNFTCAHNYTPSW